MYLSKSEYCELWQCVKLFWLSKFKPELARYDDSADKRFSTGTEVGELAKGLFGAFSDATVLDGDGKPDIAAMLEKTGSLLSAATENICEAAFSFDGLYCAVDILRKQDGGYAVYEVKSSTHLNYIYIADVAYQAYVLAKCGVKITGTYLVNIDSSYVFDGTLDIHKLFKITDIGAQVREELQNVYGNLAAARRALSAGVEPIVTVGTHCTSPYACPFFGYCTAGLTSPSVFDLYGMAAKDKFELYNAGFRSLDSVAACGRSLNAKQRRQIEYSSRTDAYADADGIASFLDKLSYPLYFLDFETMQLAVPEFAGTSPYAQIPFQYSLHFIEREDGELNHKEFLADAVGDPRRALAARLCEDIPIGACVLAYNKSFECARIRELARMFDDLAPHLLGIEKNIVDLIEPFRNGWYYTGAMGGSFSIKSVLPAMFPGEPELDYGNLTGVHNGAEAMSVFPTIKNLPPDEALAVRASLLRYCALDTYAMVAVWRKLKSIAENNRSTAA